MKKLVNVWYRVRALTDLFFRGSRIFLILVLGMCFCGCTSVNTSNSIVDNEVGDDLSVNIQLGSFHFKGLISHRGYAIENPENTMAAFEASVNHGYQAIETDINISKDGVPVCMHDITLERTSDGTGELTSFTIEELKRLDAGSYFGEQFKGERIPTLEEFLLYCKENDIYAELDLVREPIYDPDNLKIVYETVKNTNMKEKTIFTVSPVQMDTLVSLDTNLIICYAAITNESEMTKAMNYLDRCDTMIASIPYRHYDNNLADLLHRNHFMIKVWTVDDVELVQSYFDEGVDLLITDSVLPEEIQIIPR